MTLNEYLNLVTSQYRQQPNFINTLTANLSILTRLQDLLNETNTTAFDIETAVGDQLDVIGKWVGLSRQIPIPIPGVYFSWDGTDPFVGWDFGSWQPLNSPTEITTLPDDVYRTFIKAKIAANRWDGTTTGAYEIWDQVFSDITILIQDNQNMTYDLALIGEVIDSLTLALLENGFLPLKPEGVRINILYIPVDDNPLFGWDIENDFIKGWDEGSWARELA